MIFPNPGQFGVLLLSASGSGDGAAAAGAEVAAPNPLAALLILMGVVILAAVLMISIRQRIVRRQVSRLSGRQMIDQVKNTGRSASDRHDGEARLHETAQRLAAQLDNKAERLEQLLQEAQLQTERLTALLERAGETDRWSDNRAETEQITRSAMPRNPLHDQVCTLADQGCSAVEIARELDEQTGKVELILALRDHSGVQ